MATVVFIGTFDPFLGAHLGQVLRANHYRPFSHVKFLVDKHPIHKPNANDWHHRLRMAELTLAACKLPFSYEVIAVENSTATEITDAVDYKITGIDSLLDNVNDPTRWVLTQRWPMIVLSIPGIPKTKLDRAIKTLPSNVRQNLRYEYVSKVAAPGMNYDFEKRTFTFRRVHASDIRAGKESAMIPPTVKQYIKEHNLYAPLS